VTLEPNIAGYLDTLAEVHFRRGDAAKAVEFAQRCLELDPRNTNYQQQLERFRAGHK
jgi:hypothetical protein